MKKFVALMLALLMAACATVALATDSKETIHDLVLLEGEGTVQIIWLTDTIGEDGTAVEVRKKVAAAANESSPLDVLPEEIRAQLPEGFTTVNELESLKLEGDLTGLEQLPVTFKFATPYDPGSMVYLAVCLPGETPEWLLLKGAANEEGSVAVTFDADSLAKIGSRNFVLMVISEK
jgi:hypothetical protein